MRFTIRIECIGDRNASLARIQPIAASSQRMHHATMTALAHATTDSRIVVGTMTGTSLDGDIDVAAVRIDGHGHELSACFIEGISHPLGALIQDLRRAAQQEPMTAMEFAQLAHAFGQAHAHAIHALCTGCGITPDLVVLHGQTVFHAPPLSWQLLNPWPVATAMQCRVRFDLRAANLASGGEGAPITPLADLFLFGSSEAPIGVLNLGGFANATLLPRIDPGRAMESSQHVRGFDVCACNHLLDRVARERLGKAFDEDGNAARAGVCDGAALDEILHAMRAHAKESLATRRSLGTGDESARAIDATRQLSSNDACRTIVEAIARTIVSTLRDAGLRDEDTLLLAGGSARHHALVQSIARARTGKTHTTMESHGVPVGMREPVGIAVLGTLAEDGLSYCLEQVVGAKSRMLDGASITPMQPSLHRSSVGNTEQKALSKPIYAP